MIAYLFSCENATCAVPEAQRELFRGAEEQVASSEGWEPGALNLAQAFAMRFRTPLVHGDITRLLVDLEKDGDETWSRFSIKLPEQTRSRLKDRHQRVYRTTLEQRVTEDLRRHETVIHLLIHTDPELDGTVVLETSPKAVAAQKIAGSWCQRIREGNLGASHSKGVKASALASALENMFHPNNYAQIVLRVSQSFFLKAHPWRWETLKKHLLDTLAGEKR